MQKELQKIMTNNLFWTRKEKKIKHTTTTKQKSNQKSLPEPGIEPGTSHIAENTFFCNILTCMGNLFGQILIFTGAVNCLSMVE